MRAISAHEFPPEIDKIYRRARVLEWVTLGYIASSSLFLYLTMGNSQAMRTSFFEELISSVPAIAFLVCTRIARTEPTANYPYGMHRATSIGHLVAALALAAMGLFLLFEGSYKLLAQEKASIGSVTVLGNTIWAGWPMLAALIYTGVPPVFLGRMKAKLAPELHDKVLHADADMMKADWMTETATAIGVIGLGFGMWWLDPLAAVVVSAEILKDGITNVRFAMTDLADRRPRKADDSDWEQLPYEIGDMLRRLDWVEGAEVRMREEGHIFMGEAFVVPNRDAEDLVLLIEQAVEEAKALDWRVHDLVITPVARLSGQAGAGPQRDSSQA